MHPHHTRPFHQGPRQGIAGREATLATTETVREEKRLSAWVLSAVALLAVALLQPLRVSAAAEGRFHLVYLVSAVDLKPGSKVYVDPIFFTDGKEVRGFHGYCETKAAPSAKSVDVQLIDSYCARKSFTVDPKGFQAINNYGQQLTIGPITFKVVDELTHPDSGEKDFVMMGQAQVTSYSAGAAEPPKWLRGDGAPEHFFLMSKNSDALKHVVPVSHVAQSEIDALANRAMEFSKIAKWRVAGSPLPSKDIQNARLCFDVEKPLSFRLENPIVVDFDVDGKLDMLVNVHATVKLEKETDQPLIDCFTTYRILGNGDAVLIGKEQWPRSAWAKARTEGGQYHRYLRNGYPVNTQMIAFRRVEKNRNCTYFIQYSATPYAPAYLQHPFGYTMGSVNCGKSFQNWKLKSIFFDTTFDRT